MSSRVDFCRVSVLSAMGRENKIKLLVIYVDSETNKQPKTHRKKKLKSNVRQFEIDFFGSPLCAKLVRQPSEIRSTYLVSQAVQSPPTELSNSASSVPIGGVT